MNKPEKKEQTKLDLPMTDKFVEGFYKVHNQAIDQYEAYLDQFYLVPKSVGVEEIRQLVKEANEEVLNSNDFLAGEMPYAKEIGVAEAILNWLKEKGEENG